MKYNKSHIDEKNALRETACPNIKDRPGLTWLLASELTFWLGAESGRAALPSTFRGLAQG